VAYREFGKSSLVTEFEKHVELMEGYSFPKKFWSINKKNPPLSSVLLALSDLINQFFDQKRDSRNIEENIA